ncbi:hypothetical protein T492DRAFT_857958 [Pavlovales sp. CCMP2436]|nr:hypothetical protein T492DRAFT_857958 [Pavlovales sp. CCMP2436]
MTVCQEHPAQPARAAARVRVTDARPSRPLTASSAPLDAAQHECSRLTHAPLAHRHLLRASRCCAIFAKLVASAAEAVDGFRKKAGWGLDVIAIIGVGVSIIGTGVILAEQEKERDSKLAEQQKERDSKLAQQLTRMTFASQHPRHVKDIFSDTREGGRKIHALMGVSPLQASARIRTQLIDTIAARGNAQLLLARSSALALIAAQRGNTTNSKQQIISLTALAWAHYRRSIGTRGGAQASAAD